MEVINVTFGENLRALRIQRHFSQQRVADDLELSQSSVASYENNMRNPTFETIRKFADYFGVSPAMLMSTDEAYKADDAVSIAEIISHNPKSMELFDIVKSLDDKSIDVLITVASSLKQ